MATLLSCQDITKAHAARPLFTRLTLGIDDDARIGLIGPNGAGKSTLLKIFAGLDTPDSGSLSVRRGLKVGYVPQEERFDDGASVETILQQALSSETIEASERETRIEIFLARCAFPDRRQPAGQLSGGWRKRLAIASALLRQPDLVLFDEPTNHLDLAGVEWLEQLLDRPGFAFVVVTHDRYFLENVATRLIELNPIYAEGFLSVDGGYSDYLLRRAEYAAGQGRRQEALQSQARREIAWLRRGARARSTKAKGRIEDAGELLAELEEVKRRRAERQSLSATFTSSNRKTRELIVARGIGVARGGRELFAGLDLTLSPGMKLGVIGANGSGKTTLLRILAGALAPDTGTLRTAESLQSVWFDQERTGLDRGRTVREALSPNSDTVLYRDAALHVSAWAKRFGFRSDQLDAIVSTLSGGEQARVQIARLMLQRADVLILDEPTNDLDLMSLEALEEGLESFPGAVVLVTHDRYLLDRIANIVLVLGEGAPAFYADYSQWATRRTPPVPPSPPSERGKRGRPEGTRANASLQASSGSAGGVQGARLTASERKELSLMETRILEAEALLAQHEERLHDPGVASDAARLQAAWDDHAAARAEIDRLFARWEELEARRSAG